AACLEVPPDRIVDRVVRERAETAPAERRHAPPAQRALRRLAPASGAEREVEAQLDAARRARRARDFGRVVAPQAEEAAGRGPQVAVDHVGGTAPPGSARSPCSVSTSTVMPARCAGSAPTGCPLRAAAPSDRRRGRGWHAPTSPPAAFRRREPDPAAR